MTTEQLPNVSFLSVIEPCHNRTPDEDFGILLEAAKLYDDMTHDLKSYPRLLFVITGKGPMREGYRKKMSQMEFRKVAFRLMWLSAEDYPR